MARGWAISGISEQTREAVTAAADEAGMPVGTWVEKALSKALAEGLEAGVSIEEIETRMRAVVAQELQPVQEALVQLARPAAASTPNQSEGSSSPIDLMRHRLRQRRLR